jgi:hypothetical protein|tara:strand:- start:6112 stop:6300 length:189 start_codon:yes stop_codon:yes gene_type:complete
MEDEVLEDILASIPDDMSLSDIALVFVNIMIHFDMENDHEKVLTVTRHFMEAYNGVKIARYH